MVSQSARWLVTGVSILAAACTAKPVQVVKVPPPTEAAAARVVQPASPPPRAAPRTRVSVVAPTGARYEEFYEKEAVLVDTGAARESRGVADEGDISLKFEGADLKKVVGVILGDLLRRNYVIDPDVTGSVTLATDRPLNEAQLIPTLEAILASQGAKLAAYEGVYRVTRAGTPSALAGGGLGVGRPLPEAGAGLRIFPLEFIAAPEMAKVLQPLLPEGAVVHTDKARNLLFIAGSGPDLSLAANTVEIFDVDQMAGHHVLMVGMENADARTVLGEVEEIFQTDGVSASHLVRFIPVDRLNAVLVLSPQMAYIDKARKWITRLDRTRSPTDRRLFVYYVQHGRASNLAKVLKDIVADDTVGTAAAGVQPATAKEGEGKDGATATPVATRVSGRLGSGVRISVDEEHNALLVSATPQDFALIEEVLAKLDIQPLQVMIEVSIFEVTLRDELRYGIQYAISNGGVGLTDDGLTTLTRGLTTATTSSGIATPIISQLLPGFSFTI